MELDDLKVELSASLAKIASDEGRPDYDVPADVIRDSLDLMSLVVDLESRLGVSLDDPRVLDADLFSFDKMAELLLEILSE